ncbi:tryptophan synthase subunit alpha [Streptomyces candidus]|uniref:tryptophan synthase n=1 Tax=Streptomyces candidus TaxID=67283 RepID=A0A7X0HL55_9ACTN|nr:tryptophan synthase subunit alpha [Streptomyces candidus]MBB6439697.1 tryptophan synthase alpha subunit [Streptomyces candidus]
MGGNDDSLQRVACLRKLSNKPLVMGFGITRGEQVIDFWTAGSNGVIVGSHSSLLVEQKLDDLGVAPKEIGEFVRRVRS